MARTIMNARDAAQLTKDAPSVLVKRILSYISKRAKVGEDSLCFTVPKQQEKAVAAMLEELGFKVKISTALIISWEEPSVSGGEAGKKTLRTTDAHKEEVKALRQEIDTLVKHNLVCRNLELSTNIRELRQEFRQELRERAEAHEEAIDELAGCEWALDVRRKHERGEAEEEEDGQ